MNNKKSNFSFLWIEMILAIIIAICVVALLFLNHAKDNEINERYMETLLVPAEQIGINDKELTELITEYHPESTKMIEIYNEDLNMLYRVRFGDTNPNYNHQISNHPELMEYLIKHDTGHTYYTSNGNETDVYFKWCHSETTDTHELIIIYSSRPEARNYWLHPLICYIILMCAFSIVIISSFKRGRDRLIQYSRNQLDIFNATTSKVV